VGQTAGKPFRIDVHHHLAPPEYLSSIAGSATPSPPLKSWSVARSIEDMDRGGVATSMLSITTPGLWFGDDATSRRLARACNDYAAKLMSDHPGRFGMFVNLPLPDIEGTLREIEYGLDTLKADGIVMFTSYGDRWLGHHSLAPVFEELDRRKALIYTHPAAANCCRNLVPGIPGPMIEFGTDTTRTIADLTFGGAARRYPNVRFIFSHAGGTMPFLIERFEFQHRVSAEARQRLPDGILPELRKFYYDTAQSANPAAMSALLKVVPVSQVVFGTDYPFRTAEEHVRNLAGCGFSEAELRAIGRDNAVALLPRLRA
jgi:predicted TIM-barrel fold metal-dependent hydrolase